MLTGQSLIFPAIKLLPRDFRLFQLAPLSLLFDGALLLADLHQRSVVRRGSPTQRLPGHEFNLHEDQVLITAIDDVVLYSGSPEVCYASCKLGG